jgi:hypothetical protein
MYHVLPIKKISLENKAPPAYSQLGFNLLSNRKDSFYEVFPPT